MSSRHPIWDEASMFYWVCRVCVGSSSASGEGMVVMVGMVLAMGFGCSVMVIIVVRLDDGDDDDRDRDHGNGVDATDILLFNTNFVTSSSHDFPQQPFPPTVDTLCR